ncbi:hypothetical protein FRC08_008113 [Ceratobasidium sp. 394]|nr:hypothetical protein FRC08_008113 [Ceratobasidium sp. 394]
MPKLESLCLGLEDKPPSPDLNVNLDDIERYRHSPFHTLEVAFRKPYGCMGVNKIKSYTYHQVILLIRYLFVLWPNIRVVETKDPGTFLTNDGTPITMMALINDHLAMLSCCNRDPTLSYERVKIFNEESWNESLRVIVRRVD